MRIHVLAHRANRLGDALEATPFSDKLKELLWAELSDSGRFPIRPDGLLNCVSMAAPIAVDDIAGFRGGDGVVGLDLGSAGELLASAFWALNSSVLKEKTAHSESPDLVAQSG